MTVLKVVTKSVKTTKMKITKTQLRKIIKEEVEAASFGGLPGKATALDFLKTELGTWQPSALEYLKTSLETERFDLTEDILDIIDGALEHDSPRYETSAEADLAKFQQDRFSGR